MVTGSIPVPAQFNKLQMKTLFEISLARILKNEGIYSNEKLDFGGETVFGISRKNWPDWEGWGIVDSFRNHCHSSQLEAMIQQSKPLQQLVYDFYKENFWTPLYGQEFEQEVADELFDTAVNQGVQPASEYLQKALNLLNENQSLYPDLKVDGKIGQKTIFAYHTYMNTYLRSSRSKEKNIKVLLKIMNAYQLKRYLDIVEVNPSQEKFVYGWLLNRV